MPFGFPRPATKVGLRKVPYAHAAPGNTIELQCFYRPARQGHVRSRRKPTLVGLKGKSEDQPHAKQIAPAEGVTPPAEVRVSFLTTPLSTRGGAFRSSSDPGEGTRAPGASWASRAATTRIGPGFAMSSATRAASFPEMRCCFILVSDSGRRHQREKSSTAQHVMDNRRHCLAHLLHKSPRIP